MKPEQGTDKQTPRRLLQECMESAVRLAFIRHSEDIEFDADADTQEEIANDAACACFAEGTCTEEPIEEVSIVLNRLEAFNQMLSALKKLVAWRKGNSQKIAASFGDEYLREYLVNGSSGVTKKLELEAEAAIQSASPAPQKEEL